MLDRFLCLLAKGQWGISRSNKGHQVFRVHYHGVHKSDFDDSFIVLIAAQRIGNVSNGGMIDFIYSQCFLSDGQNCTNGKMISLLLLYVLANCDNSKMMMPSF